MPFALQLASSGLAIFPATANKHPLIKAFNENASTDSEVIHAWWNSWPEACPAIPCGRNSLIIIDCDVKRGLDGVSTFKSWIDSSGFSLDGVFSVATPSGGRHYYYRDTSGSIGLRPLGPGVDVRGMGGFVMAYDAVPAHLLPLNEAIAVHLKDGKGNRPTSPVAVDLSAVQDSDRTYAEAALLSTATQLAAVTSGRNHALNVAANAVGELIASGSLDEQNVIAALKWACSVNGYTAKDGEREMEKTMFSGLGSGKARPRPLTSAMAQQGSALQQTLKAVLPMVAPKTALQVTAKTAAGRSIKLVRLDSVYPKAVDWLWHDWLAKGKLTIIAGEGGIGKSTLAFNFAATVSNGGLWPDGTRCRDEKNILIWSSEDDTADTILPRLLAMNANVTKIGTIAGANELNGQESPFDPASDIDLLREGINRIGGVSLIIIDPIVSAVAGDMHKANDTRRSLQPLIDLAEEQGCAVVGITHFAKNTSGKAVTERVIGSQAFTALSRVTLVAKANDETGERVLLKAKANITRNGGGFHYTVEERVIQPSNIKTTAIKWGEKVDGSAQEIVDSMEVKLTGKASPKTEQAKQFLREQLKDGPQKASKLYSEWDALGISTTKTLQRASEQLGIVAKKEGYPAEVMWSFPFAKVPWLAESD